MSTYNFGIIGGDNRYRILKDMLIEQGYGVKAYCADNQSNNNCTSLDDLIYFSDVVILPIPCSKDGKHISVNSCSKIPAEELFMKMQRRGIRLVFGGVVTEEIKVLATENGIKTVDFFEQEEVAVLNGIPTAEGAIMTAMQESNRTIFGSRALVMGYGRCGKILAQTLKGIGARVSATYRSERDCAYIKTNGIEDIRLSEVNARLKDFDFIFNTIPHCVLDREALKRIDRRAIIIDIAQAPGGVDYSYARDINLKALYCPGLPGRVAPYSAAEVLKDIVLRKTIEG